MPYQDPFNLDPPQALGTHLDPSDDVALKFFNNASSTRINTDTYLYNFIRSAHPGVTVIDVDTFNCPVAEYISATGDGSITSLTNSTPLDTLNESINTPSWPSSQYWTSYIPPKNRIHGNVGTLVQAPIFDKYLIKWQSYEFLFYVADCRDGHYIRLKRGYLLTSCPGAAATLLKAVGAWSNILHDEVWVFDQGFWQKDAGLYASVQKSRWADIILPEALKEDLLDTVLRFYDSRDVYAKLRVPWKRGLIFYGPPGNGKTVSIKATMKTLLDRKESVPTLYVKSLVSFAGPEYSISQIFGKARAQAPCYLVFEDLDSLVTDKVRSFFLNAVDGLSENEGILMVGSTNHIERLDPGLAKRPSRFDRKYRFDDPDLEGRTAYCRYWRKKLADNKDVEFPEKLCPAIAKLMDGFSFAYMQEAFVSALLRIATEGGETRNVRVEGTRRGGPRLSDAVRAAMRKRLSRADETWDLVGIEEELEVTEKDSGDDGDDLDKYVLWREIKIQIKNLRKELDQGDEVVVGKS